MCKAEFSTVVADLFSIFFRFNDTRIAEIEPIAGLGVLRTDEYNCTNCNYEYFGFMVLPNLQEAFWFNFYLILQELAEPVKLQLVSILDHFFDIQLRYRIESLVAVTEGFVGELQSDQCKRYMEIKQADMPPA
ncbi:hypothetical protein B9Z55_027719 [Caenorhabditis nigoni]|uniref:Ryanodine receptor junctional solenoid domain-containing protein n=1 Tax=Caenorhabditis nigoni TaxID=1611254 RepID=A0A2G5SEV7_9PELO|nr:hypothetical protein B9Z55_027719 [Caenorhabditis nigoni]